MSIKSIGAIFIGVIALLWIFPAWAQTGETRQYFKDWLAACRSDGYCSATAYDNPNSDAGVADYVLRVGRHPQSTYWEISFSGVKYMADLWEDLMASVDGNAISFSGRNEYGPYGSINDYFLIGGKAQHLFDLMGPGSDIQLTFTDEAKNTQTADFSLSGLSAALLWIDDQQKRIGAERVTMTPPQGMVPAAEGGASFLPEELIALQRGNPECESFEDLVNPGDTAMFNLNDTSKLYMLPCTSGAYNFAYSFYMDDGYGFQKLYFADYSEEFGWGGTPILFNAWYDEASGQLNSFYKGRGLGDCGTSGIWKWHEYGFKLLEFSAKDECDSPENPGDFPVIYHATDYVPDSTSSD